MEGAPNLDPYAPCRCGSGKKYKFCCMKGDRKESKADAASPAGAPPGAVPPGGAHGAAPGAKGQVTRPGASWRPPTPRTPGRNG